VVRVSVCVVFSRMTPAGGVTMTAGPVWTALRTIVCPPSVEYSTLTSESRIVS